ncbi:MAG: mycothione reductase [Chloroflexi bacterium]|nr:mycothione reductase [Chloroflexota bacterium]
MKTYDLIVIGSGSGLEVLAEGAERGMRVAVIDHGPFGGTCLTRGCIPSKMLIHVADVMETIRNAGRFGVKAEVRGVDWEFIQRRTFEEIDEESAGILEGNRAVPNMTVYTETARFTGPKTLAVGAEEVTAPTIVIAAGTRPAVPDIPGLADVSYHTSDTVMRLPEQPRRMVIVGGGYIAAEMAHFFGALGTEVTIVHRSGVMLRSEDEDIAEAFTRAYRHRFNVLLGTQVRRVSQGKGGILVEVSAGHLETTLECDALLVATGRVPNTDLLEVDKAGITLDARGFIQTDQYLEASVAGVWALGDIAGKYQLKHSANLEAAYAANNIFSPEDKLPVDYHAMPHGVFASPQVAGVGLTEEECRAGGKEYTAGTASYGDTAYGQAIEDREGFAKVLADPHTGDILGCHIIGTHATTLIQEAANAMRQHLTVEAITQGIYVHPALPEVVQRAFGALPMH